MSYSFTLEKALKDLGLNPNQHLPAGGTLPRMLDLVDNRGRPWLERVTVHVLSNHEAQMRGVKQRTRAFCPKCAQEYALGNLHQHVRVCE